jgi:hypothetical protein
VRLCRRLHEIIGAIPEKQWTEIPYWLEGNADVAETTYVPFTSRRRKQAVRLIIRRVMPTPGSQLALQGIGYTYHAFIVRHEALRIRVGCKDPPPICRSRPVKLRAA